MYPNFLFVPVAKKNYHLQRTGVKKLTTNTRYIISTISSLQYLLLHMLNENVQENVNCKISNLLKYRENKPILVTLECCFQNSNKNGQFRAANRQHQSTVNTFDWLEFMLTRHDASRLLLFHVPKRGGYE